MNKKEEIFFSDNHKANFMELLEQADFDKSLLDDKVKLEYRQIAFLYLIALYQEEYLKYEGCKFYVENIEEISLDGPIYLLEQEYITLDKYEHEIMLRLAMKILKGECLEDEYEKLLPYLQEPLKNAINLSQGKWLNYIA